MLHLAAHQLQGRAPIQCDATALQPFMPAEQRIAQGKASALAASHNTPTSSHASVESPYASGPEHCSRQGQCSCCTSQHINFKAEHPSSTMPTSATRRDSGTPQCPRQGKCSCRVPQNLDFKLRWRRISTRQLTEALSKTRPELVLHLAAHQLQRSVRWQRISTRQLTEALPKAGPVLVLHLAAHQLQRSAPVRCDATPPQLIMPAE